MNENAFGKKVRLNEYNLSYGSKEKNINVMCFFKYKKDNNLYAICCDETNIPYGIMNYGGAHLKGNTLLLIGSKDPNQEMVKEILFKIDSGEPLEDFEVQDISQVELIELVSPNKFEVKKEVLQNVVDKTMPKPVVSENKNTKDSKKKNKTLPILLIFIIIAAVIFYFFVLSGNQNKDNTVKSIVCTKEYASTEFEAKVLEDNTYNFNQNDILEYVDKSTTYQFYTEEEYLDFINRGLYFPLIENSVGHTLDNDNYKLTIIEKDDATKDYFLPTEYEEVLSHYKNEGYSCTDQIEE